MLAHLIDYNSKTIGLECTLQVSACIPNFGITKYFVNFKATGRPSTWRRVT